MDEFFNSAPLPSISGFQHTPIAPDEDDITTVAGLIADSQHPVMVLGSDVWAGGAEIAALRDVPFLVVVQEGRAQKAFNSGGFSELLGRSRFFDTIPLAIAAYPNLRANRQNRAAEPDVEDHVR